MKYDIDWNIMKRNILIVFIAILFILFLIQRCNRTTLAQYLDSKGVEVEKMSIKDTEVIYRGLFGEEPDDFMIEYQEEKVEFISQLNDITIRRDYISEIQLQLFGKTSRSVDMNPSSNQIITTGLNDPDSNLRVSIAIFNGRRISVYFINIDEEKVYSPGLIGYIMGIILNIQKIISVTKHAKENRQVANLMRSHMNNA